MGRLAGRSTAPPLPISPPQPTGACSVFASIDQLFQTLSSAILACQLLTNGRRRRGSQNGTPQ
jgi:hypothetical protein